MPALPHQADLILRDARVYTLEEERPWADAVAIRKHRIIAVGKVEDVMRWAGTRTEIIDLDGALVLPGLCDAHIHFYDWSLGLQEVVLTDTAGKEEMLRRIADHAAASPDGGWIKGAGWNESRWGVTQKSI